MFNNVKKIQETEENSIEKSEVEMTNVLKWLWEKDQFDILRRIKLFRLFRKRKTFRDWRKNVRESKQLRSKYEAFFFFFTLPLIIPQNMLSQ